VTSDNARLDEGDGAGTTSDNTTALGVGRRRGRAPTPLPAELEAVHAAYVTALTAASVLDADTHRAYASRVRGYLAWLATTDPDGDPLSDPGARDGAVRDYRTHLQTVAHRKPSTINTVLAAIRDFHTRTGRGAPDVARLELPGRGPRALDAKDATRWLRTVERWLSCRDRVLALLPFYAGLRLGEVVALDLDDIHLSARKGLIIVRAGKGGRYREIPAHPTLRADLALWINDERPDWPGADTSPALLLNRRGTRLSARGAHDILGAIADAAHLQDDFTSHVLRHTFGTTLVRQGHDLVLVAELLGHARLDTVRAYSLPTDTDRQHAIDGLLTDR
jgi:site-specific recombinase XerD